MPTALEISERCINGEGISLIDALIHFEWVKSKKEARQKIKEGAVKFDGKKIIDINARIINIDGCIYCVEID